MTTRATEADLATAPQRFLVQFESEDALRAAQAVETPGLRVPVVNARRRYVSVAPTRPGHELDEQLEAYVTQFGATVVPERQYALEQPGPDDSALPSLPDNPANPSLEEVLSKIRARDAWRRARGAGISIAVIDTGISVRRPELAEKRVDGWAPSGEDPWQDYIGHGTMCATIALGRRAGPESFDGVAPDAGLISCRTRFFEGELAAIYDFLTDRADSTGEKIIATNSFGERTGDAPEPSRSGVFEAALADAIEAGVLVFFSAGNNHGLAGGKRSECRPTSIWLHKCRSDVMTVGACDLNSEPWYYSSRGPGQYFGEPDMGRKPDVSAPTPANGRVPYGEEIRVLEDGWGTSGAAPQVAGLAGLLLSRDPGLSRADVFGLIKDNAVPVSTPRDCLGSGVIDCLATIRGVS